MLVSGNPFRTIGKHAYFQEDVPKEAELKLILHSLSEHVVSAKLCGLMP